MRGLFLAEEDSVFNLVLKDMNLQFKSVKDNMYTSKYTQSNVTSKILVISVSRLVTNGADLIRGRDGVAGTHKTLILTNKYKKRTNLFIINLFL